MSAIRGFACRVRLADLGGALLRLRRWQVPLLILAGLILAAAEPLGTALGQVPNRGKPVTGLMQIAPHPVIPVTPGNPGQAAPLIQPPVHPGTPSAQIPIPGGSASAMPQSNLPITSNSGSPATVNPMGNLYQGPTGQSVGANGAKYQVDGNQYLLPNDTTVLSNAATSTSIGAVSANGLGSGGGCPPHCSIERQTFPIPPNPTNGDLGGRAPGSGVPSGGVSGGASGAGVPGGSVQTSYQMEAPLARASVLVTCVLDDRRHFCTFDYATPVAPRTLCHCGQYTGSTQ